ncbi:MAG: KpsF/GutQ family sugar-phosphate isomerase [Chlamydiales bacterium]|nr:KpsF/GutQ family sugar-phosphate isomerase [Chlamydiia bacterium]MCP5508692.1 KpsF/GutQ family sugar-phosphate isomerase [Chlamydiales bacterium]
MIEELIKKERESLDYFFDHVDVAALQEVFNTLNSCKGVIIMTGIGKSGLIAKKIAATMTSTNTRAIYLSPVDALHGDIGIVSQNDVFLFFSKSGESDELLNLVPALRNKGVKMIAVVCNPTSRLAKACDSIVTLPMKHELCPHDMAPTISTTVQMIFGDLMAVALMMEHRFSLDDFALNHPAGRIGKRITMKVRDLMITNEGIPLSRPQDKLVDTLVELSNKRCGCVLIVDDKKALLGIFTDGDLRRTLQSNGPEALNSTMETVMTSNPRHIAPDVLATEALKVMEGSGKSEVAVLPVLENGATVVGVIKLHDIIQSGI